MKIIRSMNRRCASEHSLKRAIYVTGLTLTFSAFAYASSDATSTQVYGHSPASYSLPDDVPAQMLTMTKAIPVNGTLRQSFLISAGGSRIRVRISNEAGNEPLVVGSASIALAKPESSEPLRPPVPMTFGGNPGAVVPVGAPLLSDPVQLSTKALDRVTVSVFTPSGASNVVLGATGMSLAPGDQTLQQGLTDATLGVGRSIISGVTVSGKATLPVVVALGDSITDGARIQPNQPAGYPETLMRRAAKLPAKDRFSVVNAGIGGNRLLTNGWGPSILARLDRDVLRIPNVSHLIVLAGINDIGLGGPPLTRLEPSATAAQLIAGYQQVIERAHAHGIKVIGGTLLPFEGATYFTPEKEATRQATNAWIRNSGAFDAVVDFDEVMRDPEKPTRLNPAFDPGDHLHPNDDGYRAMGEAIDLSLFH